MFECYQHIHFVGIGGVGMSGIAEVLLNLGYVVSGSDQRASETTRRLKRRGAKIFYGHKASAVEGAHVVVVSAAIGSKNPEVVAARDAGIPVVARAEMLAELMRLKYGIAIAGTHGKTTTTTMVAQVLAGGRLDPTIVIGGKVNGWRTNARLGKGDFLVAEADESDRSFLRLTPTIAVITNIDPEHMENYRTFAAVKKAYLSFAERVPFYGAVVGCIDHPVVRELMQRTRRPVVSYGLDPKAYFSATDISQNRDRMVFTVRCNRVALGQIKLRAVGHHNVKNALAAVAVGRFLKIPFSDIAQALGKFKGIERRFEILHSRGPLVVNDYAHHPIEIMATLEAVKGGWRGRKVILVHQPHRYTRLLRLWKDFISVLATADVVVLLPLYPAGERAIPGVSSRKLLAQLRTRYPKLATHYVSEAQSLTKLLSSIVDKESILLFLGAGDIWKIARKIGRDLRKAA